MPIDFHDQQNQETYASREADRSWSNAMQAIVAPRGKRVADIGCGGGIYSRAWADLGAAVVGVDISAAQLAAARERSTRYPDLRFQLGSATASGLDDRSVDIVFERAVIHHGVDLLAAAREAARILTQGGIVILQDRTLVDVSIPGSPSHLRGYIFGRFPRLLSLEAARRPEPGAVEVALHTAGFKHLSTQQLWEIRRTYANFDELAPEFRARTGRSILHELSDAELDDLIAYLAERLPCGRPLVERDRWTIWSATMPESR